MALSLIVDGQAIPAPAGGNLLAACLAAGLDLPYFCWHKALGSVGSCRQCAVKIFKSLDDNGQIVMACMTPVTDGLRVSIADQQAARFREAVIEAVLTNHPHDCPVCEVGGECHLQDMTALTGHTTRRDRFAKRTHLNQDLGPFIKHEMNRCIGCYRCVRFYRDYAGGNDFGVFGAHRNIYFGRAEEGPLESEFAGNLVEVCPTGVFVDKPFSAVFRRKWDLRASPSICPHCAVGCNITLQERAGQFRRVVNRYNETLNGYFLCDRGRFGAGFLESPERLRHSARRSGETITLAAILQQPRVIGIGSPRASVEANFALRQVVGVPNFYAGLSDFEADMLQAAAAVMRATPLATLQEMEQADAILLLGDDPLVAAPRLALALRQAAERPPASLLADRQIPAWADGAARTAAAGQRIPVIIVSPTTTWLDDIASAIMREADDAIARRAFAIAEQIASGIDAATDFAKTLGAATAPVIVAGGSPALLRGAANIVLALRQNGVAARLCVLLPEANSAGLALMAAPRLSAARPAMANAPVIVLENDLSRRGAQPRPAARTVIALDHIETPTSRAADLAIAVGSFADGDGIFINLEGRVQNFHKAIFGAEDPPASWTVLRDAGISAGRLPPGRWATRGALLEELAQAIPALALCRHAAPEPGAQQRPTLPHRFSGRTAMTAHVSVREPAPPVHEDSPLGTTMEGGATADLAPLVWAPGWNSGQAINKAPAAAFDAFLFDARGDAELFPTPPLPWPQPPPARPEELSALSPAIIAREQAG